MSEHVASPENRAVLSRRTMLAASLASALCVGRTGTRGADKRERTIGLGFSLYGMKSLSIADALRTCATAGYDCVELPIMPDWPADSAQLSAAARRDLRAQLDERHLRLSALMENLPALGDEAQHAAHQERLKRACSLAAELKQGKHVPLVETILGGRAGEFEAVKDRLADRVRQMAKVAADAGVVLAIKAHVSNATQRPEQLVWLLEQAASPYLKAAYDYSHFQLQELALAKSLSLLLPHTAFIHLKDTEHAQGKRGFLLPGEGTIDYGEYFRLLGESKYRGDVVVEVSSQVFSRPGYDPQAAARQCYNHLAPAMVRAGLRRG
jgi:inosose dehydratase